MSVTLDAVFNTSARRLAMYEEIPGGLELVPATPGEVPDEVPYQKTWEFIRTFHEGRYSSRSLMDLVRAQDMIRDARRNGDDLSGQDVMFTPVLLTLQAPVEYNADTEVKTGGMAAALSLKLNDGYATGMLAVADDHRREGLGRLLVNIARSRLQRFDLDLKFWTASSQRARGAMQFLLSIGYSPETFSRTGALRWSVANMRDEYEETYD